jgi:hypothetical protein
MPRPETGYIVGTIGGAGKFNGVMRAGVSLSSNSMAGGPWQASVAKASGSERQRDEVKRTGAAPQYTEHSRSLRDRLQRTPVRRRRALSPGRWESFNTQFGHSCPARSLAAAPHQADPFRTV